MSPEFPTILCPSLILETGNNIQGKSLNATENLPKKLVEIPISCRSTHYTRQGTSKRYITPSVGRISSRFSFGTQGFSATLWLCKFHMSLSTSMQLGLFICRNYYYFTKLSKGFGRFTVIDRVIKASIRVIIGITNGKRRIHKTDFISWENSFIKLTFFILFVQ